MCFLYLLLGHLLGDFILQTDNIAENKAKHRQWLLVHAVIATLSLLVFSIPFGPVVISLSLLSGMLHYFIDYYKIEAAKKIRLPGLIYFIFDQGIHIFTIYLISLFAVVHQELLLINWTLLKILLVFAFISSFAAVFNQFIIMLVFPGVNKRFFEEDEKNIGNMTRIVILFGIYLSYAISLLFLIFVALIFGILIYHFNRKWFKWMSVVQFILKIALDTIISLAGFAALIFF